MSAVILVVDDDPDIQGMLEVVISSAGYSVAIASSGEEALAFLEGDGAVCLVLLDLMMPGMNGLQFLAELAKNSAHASIPVVAVSGAGPTILSGLPTTLPILRKPFGVNELLRTIERHKSSPPGPNAAARP
jgi:CheY-like chemotaxis protein